MTILGIDTSSSELSICLCVDGTPLSAVCRYARNSHAEHIAQAVKTVLDLGGVDAGRVTHVAVSAGPGSFTGLRIGLSFVKGFCLMTERKVIPLSSLMALAHAVACCQDAGRAGFAGSANPIAAPAGGLPDDAGNRHAGQKIFAALDARQGRIHWAGFVSSGKSIRRLSGDRLSSPEELLNELSADDILVTDAMGYSRSTVFNMFDGRAKIISAERSALRRGLSCASLAFERIGDESLWRSAGDVVPNYLQMSAAEEKLCN